MLKPAAIHRFRYVLGIAIAGVLLAGCQSFPQEFIKSRLEPSPTVIPSPPLTISYQQSYMGFSLQLPSSWEGYYKEDIPLKDPTTGEFDTVFLDYVPTKGESYMIIGITRVLESEWTKLNQDPGFIATELGRRDGNVYYGQTSQVNPYPGADAQRYQQFSLDVPRILETFAFIPEASP